MTGAKPDPDLPAPRGGAPRRVILAGNYGSVNLGDELLLRVIAGWVRDAGGVPVAVSVHPDHTRAMHGIEAVHYADAGALARAVADADLMVLGGGGLLQDYDALDEDALVRFPAFEATQFAQYTLLATALDVPYVALAQGVGPLRGASPRRIARHVFASAIAASLRDEASAQLLRDVGCANGWPVAPDPAWAWRPTPAEALAPDVVDARLAGRRVLAVVLRDWPYDPDWAARFVSAFGGALPDGWACLWIDFHRDPKVATQSSDLVARLARRLPGLHVEWRGADLDEAARLIAGCDATLAMRLHAALLALAAGRPTVTLEYDAKVGTLARDTGLPDVQRVALDAIEHCLPTALGAVCGEGGAGAWRLPAEDRDRIATAALAHRDVLWQAMERVAVCNGDEPERFRWLTRWTQEGSPAAPAFVEALERRLHRQLDRYRALHAERERLLEQLAGMRAEADGHERELAQLRHEAGALHEALAREQAALEAAQRDAAHWQHRYQRIEQSPSYRLTAPLRRIAGAWREGRSRDGEGEPR